MNPARKRRIPIEVLIVTALQKELQPAIEIFNATPRREENDPGPAYDGRLDTPTTRDCDVRLLCLHDMGGRAASLAAKAIDQWKPRCVLLIGIAAMNPNAENLELGDPLIATDIIDATHLKMDGSKVKNDQPERPDVVVVARKEFRKETLPCDRHLWRSLHDYATNRTSSYRTMSPTTTAVIQDSAQILNSHTPVGR